MVATRAFPGWGFVVLSEKVTGIQGLAGPHHGQGEAVIVSTTATTGVAGRYASALFELADDAKALDSVAQDLDTFRKLLAESVDLRRLIGSPVIGRELQGKALLAVLDAAGELDHLAGLDAVEAVDAGDTVTDGEDLADLGDFGFVAEVGDLLLQNGRDLGGADIH